jgi:hypothetical protein
MSPTSYSNTLLPTSLTEAHLERVRKIGPPAGPRALVVRLGGGGGLPEPRPGEVVIFASFLTAGLVPPFSEFFIVALNFYGIHLAHLVPNSVVILSTFAHLCEMFLGIQPNLMLFRHLYTLRSNSTRHTVGSCSFRLRDTAAYIPMSLRDKWEAWTKQWMYIQADVSVNNLTWPARQADWQESWTEPVAETPELTQVLERLRSLRVAGLTGAMVIGDFVQRRISPLRRRERLACFYTGPDDLTRTFVGGKPLLSRFYSQT